MNHGAEEPTPPTQADETLQRVKDYCASIRQPEGSSLPSDFIGVGMYVATTRILQIISGSGR